jgi:hypothetical protein
MRRLAQKIHETQKLAARVPVPAPSLETQIAILHEIITALIEVVGPAAVQAKLDARRAARAVQPKKGSK